MFAILKSIFLVFTSIPSIVKLIRLIIEGIDDIANHIIRERQKKEMQKAIDEAKKSKDTHLLEEILKKYGV